MLMIMPVLKKTLIFKQSLDKQIGIVEPDNVEWFLTVAISKLKKEKLE